MNSLKPVTREHAELLGFQVFNSCPHYPVEVPADGHFTLTLKFQNGMTMVANVMSYNDPRLGGHIDLASHDPSFNAIIMHKNQNPADHFDNEPSIICAVVGLNPKENNDAE